MEANLLTLIEFGFFQSVEDTFILAIVDSHVVIQKPSVERFYCIRGQVTMPVKAVLFTASLLHTHPHKLTVEDP